MQGIVIKRGQPSLASQPHMAHLRDELGCLSHSWAQCGSRGCRPAVTGATSKKAKLNSWKSF